MGTHESIRHHDEDTARNWHFITLLLGFFGFCISLYGTYHHRLLIASGKTDAFCNINQTFNCDAVASSVYSRFLTIPWSVWGLAYFFTILVLLLCSMARYGNRKEHLFAYTVSVAVGGLVSIALAFISFKLLGVGCLICIATYFVNLGQVLMLFVGFKKQYIDFRGMNFKNYFASMVNTLIGVATILIAYNIVGEKDLTEKKVAPVAKVEQHEETQSTNPGVSLPLSLTQYSGLGEDYRKGPDDAKIVLQIFSDFQCPACRNVSSHLEEIFQSYPGKILMVYRNYPLDNACNPIVKHKMHQHACTLALMGRCAGLYGKFWQFHDIAFDRQGELTEGSPQEWAKEAGLTQDQVTSCLKDKGISDKLADDIKLGNNLGLEGTPIVFLNGIQFPIQNLKDEVKKLAGL